MPWSAPEARALCALRLNRQFPPWRPLAGHLAAIQLALPQAPRCPRTGWPEPESWAQVAIDRRLAPELLARLAFLEQAGDPVAAQRARVLRGLQERDLLPPGGRVLRPIQRSAGRWELVVDLLQPQAPRFVRWTLRGRLPVRDEALDPELEAWLDEAVELPCATLWRALQARGVEPEELVRGEIGPLRLEPEGPWVSAVLSRASSRGELLALDDPLSRGLPVPEPGAGFAFSRQRKWGVPRAAKGRVRAWLDAVGSRNIVYTYGDPR